MRNTRSRLLGFIIATTAFYGNVLARDYTQYVNPLVGSESSFELSTGNTYPAIAVPWGMNFWTPQTGKNGDGWVYTYDAHTIRGIKQTHQPSPWINDYGEFSLMPTVGTPIFDEEKRASWFSHKAETALPHYYKVYLADYDVTAEVAPTERAAMMRFTFPATAQANVVIDGYADKASVTIDEAHHRITGYTTRNCGGVPENFRNYFVVEFDHPFTAAELADEGRGAIVTFSTTAKEQVHARVASSFISLEQAELNLRELGELTFDQVKAKGCEAWNAVLGKIDVQDDSVERMKTFYSCLYRSLLFPRKFYEIDANGNVRHYSPHTGNIANGYLYTDTGLWDTFRCLFPLLNFLYPDTNLEIQEGMLNHYRESGFIPEWGSPGHRGCMVGNNSASVLADAWLKGVKVSDTATLWEAVTHGAHAVHPTVSSSGRLGYEYYDKLGYVPYNVGINESAARTLEYAYDDWCIYQLGKSLGKSDKELEPYKKAALNYRNLYDKDSKLMRGRNEDGTFQTPFSPLKWGDAFTEGNAWHYTWSVFHDPQGLANLMGGKAEMTAMLDSVFNVAPLYDDSYYGFPIHEIREMTVMDMGNYAHGNQPIQHMIYLYDWTGESWKAQKWVREVMDRMYTPYPDGYCGDEDNGQTSAWYVFSALGFYPVCPGSGEYAIGAPLFKKATLHFDNGKSLTLSAPANSNENIYIDRITMGGKAYTPTYFRHSDLLKGGEIIFDMSATPNTKRGTGKKDTPYSFSK
jgi:predicted alpha-1,2-mannosidase